MLYRAKKVLALDIEPVRLHWQLLGEVQGTQRLPYEVSVEMALMPDGEVDFWESDCSCPVGSQCKHGVALMLEAADQGLQAAGRKRHCQRRERPAHAPQRRTTGGGPRRCGSARAGSRPRTSRGAVAALVAGAGQRQRPAPALARQRRPARTGRPVFVPAQHHWRARPGAAVGDGGRDLLHQAHRRLGQAARHQDRALPRPTGV